MSASVMVDNPTLEDFSAPDLLERLVSASQADLDELPFGVIAMTPAGIVIGYNAVEQRLSGLSSDRVIGRRFFDMVAPCMNNDLVADRFENEPELDDIIHYVLTLRMKPTKVRLRLLRKPGLATMFLLVERS